MTLCKMEGSNGKVGSRQRPGWEVAALFRGTPPSAPAGMKMTPAGNTSAHLAGGIWLECGPQALRAMARDCMASASSPGLSLCLGFLL